MLRFQGMRPLCKLCEMAKRFASRSACPHALLRHRFRTEPLRRRLIHRAKKTKNRNGKDGSLERCREGGLSYPEEVSEKYKSLLKPLDACGRERYYLLALRCIEC